MAYIRKYSVYFLAQSFVFYEQILSVKEYFYNELLKYFIKCLGKNMRLIIKFYIKNFVHFFIVPNLKNSFDQARIFRDNPRIFDPKFYS